jgi:pilus assembly protein Flp/PilA
MKRIQVPNERGWGRMKKILKFFKDEDGPSAVEYGLLAALIAVVIIGAVTVLGQHLSKTFTTISNAI